MLGLYEKFAHRRLQKNVKLFCVAATNIILLVNVLKTLTWPWPNCSLCLNIDTGEALCKGKAQYSWYPCTNLFRPTAFYIQNIINLCYKTSYLNEEVNCTEPSPSASVPYRQVWLDCLLASTIELYYYRQLLTYMSLENCGRADLQE